MGRLDLNAACLPSGIRLATLADIDGIMALEERCFGAVDIFPRRTWRHLLGAAAVHGSALSLVYEDVGELRGAVVGLLRVRSDVLRAYSLAVDPATRGQGLGRRLLAALVQAAPARCRELSLEVRIENAPARRLYESIGLDPLMVLPAYYPDGGDGVRYRARFDRLVW